MKRLEQFQKGNRNVTYKEARVYLDAMSRYGSVLGLDTIRGLLEELGNPQEDLKFIHIAGTNGKGSVLAYTSTILSKAGYRTGRYVSPTVLSYREKIQVDGEWISENELTELTEEIKEAIAGLETAGAPIPTLFEVETAMAFLYFKKKSCDLVVLESGLGGRLDATNIVKTTVLAAFATISMDHIGILGNAIEEIAADKCEIIKSGCKVVSAKQKPEVKKILEEKAERTGCPFTEAKPELLIIQKETYKGMDVETPDFGNLHSGLTGEYQKENLATALEIVCALRKEGYKIPEEAVQIGVAETKWPGRFTSLRENPPLIVDGAHNEDAAKKLAISIRRYFPNYRIHLIMGVFKDKEYKKITALLCPDAECVYAIHLPNEERTLLAGVLAEDAAKYCENVIAFEKADAHSDLEEALKTAYRNAKKETEENQKSVVIACGSLSYLGDVIQIVETWDKA